MDPVAEVTEEELEKVARVNVRAESAGIDPETDITGFQTLLEDVGIDQDRFVQIDNAIERYPLLEQEYYMVLEQVQRDLQQE